MMPVQEIRACDGGDGGVFRHSRVRIIRAIGQLYGLSRRDSTDLVVTSRDCVEGSLLCDIELVIAKLRFTQNVEKYFEDIFEVTLQAGPANGGGVHTAAGFHFGRPDLEEVVELIAGLGFDSTCAPDFPVNVHQADFACRFDSRSAANTGYSVD